MWIIRIRDNELSFECDKSKGVRWETSYPSWKDGGIFNPNELICNCPACDLEVKEKSNG